MSKKKPLDPNKTVCVCKHKGREVGRIAATAPNASDYLQELARQYGELQVDYEEQEAGGMILNLLGKPR